MYISVVHCSVYYHENIQALESVDRYYKIHAAVVDMSENKNN